MKKFAKIISLVLAMLMLASSFASCGKKDDDNKEDTKDTVANTGNAGGSKDSNGDTKVSDIAVQYWDGMEYRILGREQGTSGNSWAEHFEVWREDIPEDVVGKAVWKRNLDISQTYGINVKGYLTSDYMSVADTALRSGEDLYDLMLLVPEGFNPLAINGYMLDLYKLNYINMAHDAWMDYPNEQLSMGGRLYYTTNKFLLQDKNRCWLFFYNRDMAKELNLGHFEDHVFDGTWTVEKVIELGKIATLDSDGQPGMTKFDRWGLAVAQYYSFTQIAYGVGFSFTEKGTDGYPKFIGPTDEIMKKLDKAYSITTNAEMYFCDQRAYNGKIDWNDCAFHIFCDGRSLLYAEALSMLDEFPKMCEFEYAPLPNPKYDEKQDAYYSIPNLGNGSLLGVPSTVVDREFAGYGLEVLSEQSLYTTYDAYIENKCLLQNVVDQDAANCLRIVFEGIVYDIAFVSDIGGFGIFMRNNMGMFMSNSFERHYNRFISAAETELDIIKKAYASFEN